MTLYQNRESSLKFTRIPLFIKAYSYFFKSKWGFSFNLVWDQANSPRIKSSTFNYSFNLETSRHDSRSSFIAPLDCNVSWRSNQRNLLYSFILKIHTEDCTHIYTNQIQIDYLLHHFVTMWFFFYKNCVYRPLCTPFLTTTFIFFLCTPYNNFLFVLFKDSLRCLFIILFFPHLRFMCKCSSCGSKKYTPRRSNSTWIVIRNFQFLGFVTFLFFN